MPNDQPKTKEDIMDYNAVMSFLGRTLPMIVKNPGVKATISNEGGLKIDYSPTLGQSGGIPKGVFDPQIMRALLQGQQQTPPQAMDLPRMLSGVRYQQAMAREADRGPQRNLMQMLGPIMRQMLSGRQAMQQQTAADEAAMARTMAGIGSREKIAATPKPLNPVTAEAVRALAGEREARATSLLRPSGVSELGLANLVRGLAKDKAAVNKRLFDLGLDIEENPDDSLTKSRIDEFLRSAPDDVGYAYVYSPGITGFLADLGLGDKEARKVFLRGRTLGDVRKAATASNMSLQEYLERLYKDNLDKGLQ